MFGFIMDHRVQTREQALLAVWIIWFVLLGCLGSYVFILPIIHQGPAGSETQEGAVPWVLGGIALGIAVLSLVLRSILLGGFRRGTLMIAEPQAARRLVAGNVACFALSEAMGVFGVILSAMGYPLDLCATFVLAAVVMMIWHTPFARRFQPDA